MMSSFRTALQALVFHEDREIGKCAAATLISLERKDPPLRQRQILANLCHALRHNIVLETHKRKTKGNGDRDQQPS